MKRCEQCGWEGNDAALFCGECGAEMLPADDSLSAQFAERDDTDGEVIIRKVLTRMKISTVIWAILTVLWVIEQLLVTPEIWGIVNGSTYLNFRVVSGGWRFFFAAIYVIMAAGLILNARVTFSDFKFLKEIREGNKYVAWHFERRKKASIARIVIFAVLTLANASGLLLIALPIFDLFIGKTVAKNSNVFYPPEHRQDNKL